MKNYIKSNKTKKFLFFKIRKRKIVYLYLDSKEFLADSLFNKRNIKVDIVSHFVNNKEKYIFVLCEIKNKDEKQFEAVMEELKNKMALYGNVDYEEHCKRIMGKIKGLKEKKNECPV